MASTDSSMGQDTPPESLSQGSVCEPLIYHHVKKKDGSVQVDQKSDDLNLEKDSEDDKESPYALVIRRHISEKRETESVTVQINSQLLLNAFQQVIGSYPTVATDFKESFQLKSPFQILFHYWDQLATYRDENESPEMRQHLNLLFRFMEQEIGADKRLIDGMVRKEMISFKQAWAIYHPGDLAYTEVMGKTWLMRVRKVSYEESRNRGPYFTVHTSYCDANEQGIGEATTSIDVYQKESFPSDQPAKISSLEIYPRKFCHQDKQLEEELLTRGKKYISIEGVQTKHYEGIAQYLKEPPANFWDPDMADFPAVWLPFTETGRIVLDKKTFEEDNFNDSTKVQEIPDPELILCPPYALGYSMDRKDWCRFLVDNIHDVAWKEDMWESLILEQEQKQLLQALVTSHVYPEDTRNQPEQKGKGLVILLHGTPGSGKTLSAETAAEMSKKALMYTSMGTLNKYDFASAFEARLQELLRYATLWKAIILIDEVDVFLERRDNKSGTDTTRNALVAVFLRQLEYFSGIVFLTTNRIGSLDEAMESRIHLSISFGQPDMEVRCRIWQQVLDTVPPDEIELADHASSVLELMKHDLNGRQISNALNTARTLARFEKCKLNLSHIKTVLKVRQSFRLRMAPEDI